MRISVVTAVYNRADVISDALKSVAQQSYDNVEHVIQDAASNDGTLNVIHQYSTQKLSIESRPDTGIYDGINRGICRATGAVIGLMHSDDLFASNNVLSQVAQRFETEEVDGVYGDLVYVSATDPSRVIRYWKSGPYQPNLLKKGWMPPHPTLYLRREVFERFGVYDTSLRIAADYEAMLRYLVQGGIRLSYLPEVMVRMRVGGESNQSIAKILRKSREDYVALQRHKVGGMCTLAAKNMRKIGQFFEKEKGGA